MDSIIRQAQPDDVPQMVALSGRKRRQYAKYQPVFWREADDSDALQIPFFEAQIERDNNIVLVCERDEALVGFVIATLQNAPPVYAPGGPACGIDDFAVAEEADWQTVGTQLLEAVQREAKARGAVQTVVVCGHLDQPKREMLAALNFSIASEWYVKTLE